MFQIFTFYIQFLGLKRRKGPFLETFFRIILRPRLKARSRFLNPARFVCLFVCLLVFFGVANRHSWDADWSQVGNLETLIGSRALYSDHALLLLRFSVEELYKIMVLACQVGPFPFASTQINSEMNCIAKNKCPESQKIDTRRRDENLKATTDTCQEQQSVYFWHSLSLIYSMCGKKSVR